LYRHLFPLMALAMDKTPEAPALAVTLDQQEYLTPS
jgi:hypothetical protein